MGIHGIYKEIGPGRRVALAKLAIDKFEETGRPLRIAIDTSIWLFQIQASKGGTNPALRTFYYRLLRLIALSIHPIFVFDGPNKPPFKRNKRTGPNVASIPEFLAKQLLKQFGYPIHLAPGEAEAECALLQREGIVDAVLSEDVDTLMFGSGITIRNWSPEKSGKTPTHVNVYDAVETKSGPSGLDREGMILVALMSGGDYVPEGIAGCGPKTACEAAKAGFGSELCKIPRNNARALTEWRERLQHELKTNEGRFFKRKHGALKIPDDFPRLDILGYYTHPAISTQVGLDKLRRSINWDQDLDLPGLRDFTHDAFDWIKLEGAKHFVRSLAPSLLVRQLRVRAEQLDRLPAGNLQAIQEDEALLIKGIHGKRQHPITDNCIELRVSFTPIQLVKIDLSKEEPDEEADGPPPSSQLGGDADLDDDLPLELDDDGPKKRGPTKFDPEKPARIWVMESIVKVGVPLKVQDWEAERQRQTKQKPRRALTMQEPTRPVSKAKSMAKRTKTTGNVQQAPISQFAKVTKPSMKLSQVFAKTQNKPVDVPVSAPHPASLAQKDVIDLLSSSPARSQIVAPTPFPGLNKSISPVLEDLPPSVTRRRRRAPIQRSHTLPADTCMGISVRPSTPQPLDIIDTLDLVDSPILPSPSHLRAKRAKIRVTNNAPVTRVPHGTSVTLSPRISRQTTLDTWRATATPTKPKLVVASIEAVSITAPPNLQPSAGDIDTLDMTDISLIRSGPSHVQSNSHGDLLRITPVSTARPPLRSISSNSSHASSRSTASRVLTLSMKEGTKGTTSLTKTRRTSPRLSKTISARPAIEILDLTTPRSESIKHPSFEFETQDLTTLSSPAPAPREPSAVNTSLSQSPSDDTVAHVGPSLRIRRSNSPNALSKTSPPAAWKAREKKKRQIILRKSMTGAWDFADVDSPVKGSQDGNGPALNGKERQRWRESEVELLDLT